MCTISTVCDQFGLTARAVRYYEDRGLVRSRRDKSNRRCYDEQARARLGDVAAYRRAGLSIEDIQEIFAIEATGSMSRRECATLKLQARLVELEHARRQAQQLLKRFSAERVVTLAAGSAVAKRAGGAQR